MLTHAINKSRKIKGERTFVLAVAEYLPFRDASFDGVSCIFCLHHLLEVAFDEIVRILREGGWAIVADIGRKDRIPFPQNLIYRIKRFIEYRRALSKAERYAQFFTRQEVTFLLLKRRLRLKTSKLFRNIRGNEPYYLVVVAK
jgi:ubiquinone/menaquinone biosynthesis C-methylase UbiE